MMEVLYTIILLFISFALNSGLYFFFLFFSIIQGKVFSEMPYSEMKIISNKKSIHHISIGLQINEGHT